MTEDDGELANCISNSFTQLARQDRLFRLVLLGRSPAASAPLGSIWYDDKTGDAWIKDEENSWKTIAEKEISPRSDSEMEKAAERDPTWKDPFRRGLLETRSTLTSSLIPAMTQAYRALQCRLDTVCAVTTGQNIGALSDAGKNIVDGCLPPEELGLTTINTCTFQKEATNGDSAKSFTTCEEAVTGILNHEAEALRLLVAYDASVRTTFQYFGVFDTFVQQMRYPLLWPLLQLNELIKQLTRIPCFLGICAP